MLKITYKVRLSYVIVIKQKWDATLVFVESKNKKLTGIPLENKFRNHTRKPIVGSEFWCQSVVFTSKMFLVGPVNPRSGHFCPEKHTNPY